MNNCCHNVIQELIVRCTLSPYGWREPNSDRQHESPTALRIALLRTIYVCSAQLALMASLHPYARSQAWPALGYISAFKSIGSSICGVTLADILPNVMLAEDHCGRSRYEIQM